MIQLRDRLLARWTEAFDELDTIDQYKALVKTYRYAGGRNCDLKDFENGQFPADEDWLAEKDNPQLVQTFTYGFNQNSLPCYMTGIRIIIPNGQDFIRIATIWLNISNLFWLRAYPPDFSG